MFSDGQLAVRRACEESLRALPDFDEDLAEMPGRDVGRDAAKLPDDIECHVSLTCGTAIDLGSMVSPRPANDQRTKVIAQIAVHGDTVCPWGLSRAVGHAASTVSAAVRPNRRRRPNLLLTTPMPAMTSPVPMTIRASTGSWSTR